MKIRLFTLGFFALVLMPAFGAVSYPSNPSLAPRLDWTALLDRSYQLPAYEIKARRPWLNPARAALKA